MTHLLRLDKNVQKFVFPSSAQKKWSPRRAAAGWGSTDDRPSTKPGGAKVQSIMKKIKTERRKHRGIPAVRPHMCSRRQKLDQNWHYAPSTHGRKHSRRPYFEVES